MVRSVSVWSQRSIGLREQLSDSSEEILRTHVNSTGTSVHPFPPQTGAARRLRQVRYRDACWRCPGHYRAPCLAIATEGLYSVAVCMTQPISTIPLADASTSPLGSATRSSAPPWGTIGPCAPFAAPCVTESLTLALLERHAERPHPTIDDGPHHRPALIGKRDERIGVDALEVKMTAEACIVSEGVSHVLLRDGVLEDGLLVVTHQEHASQVTEQVTCSVRVITECLGSYAHSIPSCVR